MKLRRPAPITFERADGSKAVVPPLTRGQMRRLYELEDADPDKPAPFLEISDLRAARIGIMLEGATCTDSSGSSLGLKFFIESLTPEEETDIIHGLIAAHHGIDVAYAVDLQAALRDLVKKKTAAGAVTSS